MKLKMKILILMGSLMLLVFAVNVGMASADAGDYVGGAETDGINTAQETGAWRPVGDHVVDPGLSTPFNDSESAAFANIANNPMCPLNPGNQ